MRNWIYVALETGKELGRVVSMMAGVTVGVCVTVLWLKWTMQLAYWLIDK